MTWSYPRAATCLVLAVALLTGCGSRHDAATGDRPPKVPVVPAVQKVAADAQHPGGSICAPPPAGTIVTVAANSDTPEPRCITVRDDQRLRVVNKSDGFGLPGKQITIRWADFAPRTVEVERATVFNRTFGSYLEPGDHFLHISLYPGSAAEVYLRRHG